MGRQLRYERGVTLDKAMRVFWRNGYSGTSMRDLEAVLDMRPGSIYATFGSKEGLFLEALDKYAQLNGDQLARAIATKGTFMGGLRQFLTGLLLRHESRHESRDELRDELRGEPGDKLGDESEPPGRACMLAKTLADLEPRNAKLKGRAVELMGVFEHTFCDLLTQARARGEISAAADIPATARFIQIQVIGIRSFAEAEADVEILLGHIEDVMAAIERKANPC
ncbi:helix-turn-helix transcriptional regulator [Exilibacterium tricleocarpae]|uniref:Helix-turn-helix transcriptional regulator n=1 Tax=Exilibacterium tricleocarpae TaxID=2591008 RepID=A0A545TNS3_9GAMM|nr:TetR/AcrR family transcriptional regulator [Exilibacterium tricleocarpae]TQV78870.1 helix-turn-helix transcriptional regulator [Exilibacterium tricleocarpae]